MRVVNTLLLLTLGAAFAAALPAQGSGEKSAHEKTLKKRVERMRQAMREGKVRRYNVYVSVRLKNGSRLRGVVKEGRFVEVDEGLDFVTSINRNDKRAGMRVWYTNGSNSYIFLKYGDLTHYKIGRRLSSKQVKAIENDISKKKRDSLENFRRMQAARKKKKGEPAGTKGGKQTGGDATGGNETGGNGTNGGETAAHLNDDEEKLLAEFPPKEGWGEAKLKKLKSDRVVIGRFPNKKEKRFEGVYAEWKKALDKQTAIAKGESGGKSGSGKSTPPAPNKGR